VKIGPALRRAVVVVLALALPIGGAVARTIVDGRRELAASIELLEAGDVPIAIVHARRAASAYVPFAPHVGAAYEALREIATSAELRGDRDTALVAWRAIRSASMQTRWIVEPHERERVRADAAIARISADAPQPMSMRDRRPEDLERMHASLLARDDAPRPVWSLVLLVGIAGWAFGGYWMATRGLSAEGRLVAGPARVAAMAGAVGLVAFVLALFQA
jgi:hypothetical protein